MLITLSEKEKANLKIIDLGSKDLSKEYIEERDTYWKEVSQRSKMKGKGLWNGTLYSFEKITQSDMNDPLIYLSEMSYSDRMLKKKYPGEEMSKKFGDDHNFIHCGLSVYIITSDKKYIVGKKKMTTEFREDLYAHVSGNLNKDELEIHSLYDIQKFASIELFEETGLNVKAGELVFDHIGYFVHFINFAFVLLSEIRSDQLEKIPAETEFKKFEALTVSEIKELKGTRDFEYSKWYLGELLNNYTSDV